MLAPPEIAQVGSSLVALLTRSTKVRVLFSSSADKHTTWREDRVPRHQVCLDRREKEDKHPLPKSPSHLTKISTPLLMVRPKHFIFTDRPKKRRRTQRRTERLEQWRVAA